MGNVTLSRSDSEQGNDVLPAHAIAAHEAFFVSILGDLDASPLSATGSGDGVVAVGAAAKRARGTSTPPTDESSLSSDGEQAVVGIASLSSSSTLLPPLALSSFLPLLGSPNTNKSVAPSLADSDSDTTTNDRDGYRQYRFSDDDDETIRDGDSSADRAAVGCVRRPLTLRRRDGPLIFPLEESDLSAMRSDRGLLRSYVSECWSTPYDDDDDDDDVTDDDEDGTSSSTTTRRRRRRREGKKKSLVTGTRFLSLPSFGPTEPSLTRLPYTQSELDMVDGDEPTPESDLRPRSRGGRKDRSFHVVTTAALPWFTGTAVNPLLRAAYLSRMNREGREQEEVEDDVGGGGHRRREGGTVTLVVPWLYDRSERRILYGEQFCFETEVDQERYIRQWLREKAMLPLEADVSSGGIRILFYPARYHNYCIFAMGDICSMIADETADVCIMEEPEHLNWYQSNNRSWTSKFAHVVGIIHTNYKSYAASHYSGLVSAPFISKSSSLICRAYCHKVVKLSDTLQTFAPEKEVVSNVHGIRSEFLDKVHHHGEQNAGSCPTLSRTTCGVYFIGKLLWAKGLDRLLDLQDYYRELTGSFFEIDIYGSGPEEVEIKRAFYGRELHDTVSSEKIRHASSKERSARTTSGKKTDSRIDFPKSRYEWRRNPIPARFPGRRDHAQLRGDDYKIFVNPSLTEVLCTTTAEAIAMGKFVIIPRHPSNTWFEQFPNCLMFSSRLEFVSLLQYATHNEPTPLAPEVARELTWEAATERCIEASVVTRREERRRERLGMTKSDERIAQNINAVLGGPKGDVIRKMLGAGPIADQFQYGRVQSLKS